MIFPQVKNYRFYVNPNKRKKIYLYYYCIAFERKTTSSIRPVDCIKGLGHQHRVINWYGRYSIKFPSRVIRLLDRKTLHFFESHPTSPAKDFRVSLSFLN